MPRSMGKKVSLGGSLRVAALPRDAVDATPERLRHALREGSVGIEAGARRLADPFDALAQRRKLDVGSAQRNSILWEAGQRLRRHHHGGQLDGLIALDVSRESVDGGRGPSGSTPSETATRHRMAYHRAMESVGRRLLPVLTGIVIDATPTSRLCHLVDETAHARTAEAIVVERLREALHRLVDHWGMEAGRPSR